HRVRTGGGGARAPRSAAPRRPDPARDRRHHGAIAPPAGPPSRRFARLRRPFAGPRLLAHGGRGTRRHVALVDLRNLPEHVAIIMDGNGRWATQQGFVRNLGHREGSEAVRRTVRACRRLGIRALTLYAFSEQNWGRPSFEVSALMELLKEFLVSEREELLGKGIRLRAIG